MFGLPFHTSRHEGTNGNSVSPSLNGRGEIDNIRAASSSVASNVISAFSTFETGQFALAPDGRSWNFASSRPGTFALQHQMPAALILKPPST